MQEAIALADRGYGHTAPNPLVGCVLVKDGRTIGKGWHRQYGDLPWYDHVIGSDNKEDLNKPRDPRGYVMLKVLQDLDKAYELLPARWSTDAVYHVSKDAALAFKSRVALFEGTFRKYHAGTAFVPQDEQTFGDVTISSEYFLRQAADAAGRLVGTRSLYTGNTMGLAEKATDASYREYFLLETAETDETILARRYSERDIQKIWGGNFLRVMSIVQKVNS